MCRRRGLRPARCRRSRRYSRYSAAVTLTALAPASLQLLLSLTVSRIQHRTSVLFSRIEAPSRPTRRASSAPRPQPQRDAVIADIALPSRLEPSWEMPSPRCDRERYNANNPTRARAQWSEGRR